MPGRAQYPRTERRTARYPPPGRQGRRIMRTLRHRFHTRCPPDAGSREPSGRREPDAIGPSLRAAHGDTPSHDDTPSEAILRKAMPPERRPQATPSTQSDPRKRRCPRRAAPRSTLPPAERRPDRRCPPRATPASDAAHAERPRRASRPVRATPPGAAHCVPRITTPLGRDASVWCVAPVYPSRRPQRPSPMRPASRAYRDTPERPAQDRGLGKPAARSALGIARAQRETRQKTPLR